MQKFHAEKRKVPHRQAGDPNTYETVWVLENTWFNGMIGAPGLVHSAFVIVELKVERNARCGIITPGYDDLPGHDDLRDFTLKWNPIEQRRKAFPAVANNGQPQTTELVVFHPGDDVPEVHMWWELTAGLAG